MTASRLTGESVTKMTSYCCPDCGAEIRGTVAEGRQLDCVNCHRQFRVLLNTTGGRANLIPIQPTTVREPLGLPKGSIRAIATLGTAGCSWGLMLTGGTVPDYVLGLLLAIIGYYFGFRQKDRGTGGPAPDASRTPEPLGLPGGTIRMMLIGGFGISTMVLYSRGQLGSPQYLEFFLILAGLIAGYFFSRLFAGVAGSHIGILINHAKGLIVLVATVQLVVLLLSGGHAEHPQVGLALACVISFYFGSRS